ncbi:hypothetical protein JDV02_005374 [Purpureocillium takamizusanense]|uniref:Uncharacterized protein n=1 Tax=Purpureocillium takamizusanense TaxID=2060973 RepID=A0A9Q8QH97_9HYPO|nr:uncharacterized protein JDV02_005374 [Purpureocillium takamizusanense]UNI19166.1 hypothetical protein JDV02_005374 [Purpureocillium takamizusanense]
MKSPGGLRRRKIFSFWRQGMLPSFGSMTGCALRGDNRVWMVVLKLGLLMCCVSAAQVRMGKRKPHIKRGPSNVNWGKTEPKRNQEQGNASFMGARPFGGGP